MWKGRWMNVVRRAEILSDGGCVEEVGLVGAGMVGWCARCTLYGAR